MPTLFIRMCNITHESDWMTQLIILKKRKTTWERKGNKVRLLIGLLRSQNFWVDVFITGVRTLHTIFPTKNDSLKVIPSSGSISFPQIRWPSSDRLGALRDSSSLRARARGVRGSPGVPSGQGLAAGACPATPARSGAAGGHQGTPAMGLQAPPWGEG